jgi:MYXO-CTERM domain-containing protein
MKLKATSLASLLATAGFVANSSAATLLLSDTFDSTGSFAAPTQTGTVSPVTYSAGTLANYSEAGAMVLNFQGNGFTGDHASLNHNFATDSNTLNLALAIEFNMWADSAAGNDGWVGFTIGSTQGGYFWDGTYGFNVTQAQGQHSYKVMISDLAGTGSGFNGVTNGALVEIFIDGISQGATTKTLATDAGYITFRTTAAAWGGGSSWGLGHVDNLSVSLVPEPSAALLGGLGMLALLRRRR